MRQFVYEVLESMNFLTYVRVKMNSSYSSLHWNPRLNRHFKLMQVMMMWFACFSVLFGQNICSRTTWFWRHRNILLSTGALFPTRYLASFAYLVAINGEGIIHVDFSSHFCPPSCQGHTLPIWPFGKDLDGETHYSFCMCLLLLLLVYKPLL